MLWAVLLGGVLLSGCSLFGPPGAQLLYEERFSQADGNKWVVGDYTSFRLWIAGGKYHLECQPDHSGTVNSSDAGQFDDFELKADVEHISGADNKSAAGLIFRFVDWDNYYEFYVSPVGTFRLRKIAGGTWTNLTDQFDGDDAIHRGRERTGWPSSPMGRTWCSASTDSRCSRRLMRRIQRAVSA
ncbi:MAG: hypothetical protein ACP5G2_04215 [Candidatus Bipolaricaulaceae bacterium]